MNHSRQLAVATALVAAMMLAGCTSHDASTPSAPTATQASAEPAARTVIERFGAAMKDMPVLTPAPAVRAALPHVYGAVLAPALLQRWQAHPDEVIGREGSSPWPQKIELTRIACTASDCRAVGTVDYITSNELEHGGVFARRDITLHVTHTAAGWRIAAVGLARDSR